jgi:mannan endo-1,4-beta-mannosidase
MVGLCSCHHSNKKKSYDEIGQSGLTTRTEFMLTNLRTMTGKGIMIGHENSTIEGVGWKGDSARSDIQSCCADFPAVLSFKLNGIENNAKYNTDSIDFSLIRKAILDQFKRGGVNILTWNILGKINDNKLKKVLEKAAQFISSLQNAYGIKAPVLLNIYPTGNMKSVKAQTYKAQWNKIVTLLKQQTTNVLFVFSVDKTIASSDKTIEDYYPNDKYVDIIEADYIQALSNKNIPQYRKTMEGLLQNCISIAQAHKKLLGVMTGLESIPGKDFWTKTLLPIISSYKLTYITFGKNKGDKSKGTFCVPYPGNQSTNDFVQLYNNTLTLFMNDVNGLYLDPNPKPEK